MEEIFVSNDDFSSVELHVFDPLAGAEVEAISIHCPMSNNELAFYSSALHRFEIISHSNAI
jgi:hypothetical protein